MDFIHVQELLKAVDESSVTKVRIKDGDFEITIEKQQASSMSVAMPQMSYPMPMQMPMHQTAPQQATTPAPQSGSEAHASKSTPVAEAIAPSNAQTVKSPMIGTFYRSSSPDKPAFINVGDEVKAGQVVCIIEAMKLFNEIESEVSGKVIKVLMDDASPVEYDQPLFLVEPA